jgi:hypothetical protein
MGPEKLPPMGPALRSGGLFSTALDTKNSKQGGMQVLLFKFSFQYRYCCLADAVKL